MFGVRKGGRFQDEILELRDDVASGHRHGSNVVSVTPWSFWCPQSVQQDASRLRRPHADASLIRDKFMTFIGPALNTRAMPYYGPTTASCYMTIGTSPFQGIVLASGILFMVQSVVLAIAYVFLFFFIRRKSRFGRTKAVDRIAKLMLVCSVQSCATSTSTADTHLLGSAISGLIPHPYIRIVRHHGGIWSVLSNVRECTSFADHPSRPSAVGRVMPHALFTVGSVLISLLGLGDTVIFCVTRSSLLVPQRNSISFPPGRKVKR